MTRKILLLVITLFAALIVNAQTTTSTRRITLNESSIIKDTSGMQYPYVIWQKMMQSGDYTLKTVNPRDANPEYLLVKLTEEQKAERVSKMARPADSKFFTTGDVIKPFKIHPINGKKIDAKEWAGKTVVLNFWFIGCPPCRAEIPELNKLALKYKDNPNVLFIAVALDQDWDVESFIKKNPLAYQLVGDGRSTANTFGINLYPTNVVIDKQGKVQLHYSGGYQNGPYWLDKTIQESEKGAL